MLATDGGLYLLRGGDVDVVVDARPPGLPRVVHWGAGLGDLGTSDLEALARAAVPETTGNTPDRPIPVAVLPEHALGWAGLPGVAGHRDGADWSPLFTVTDVAADEPAGGARLVVTAQDAVARLGLQLELVLDRYGLLQVQATLTNEHPELAYVVDGVLVALPVPPVATELLDLAGRHVRERSPQRQPFHVGVRLRDGRRGRTGTDATLLLVAGTAGFGFRSGEVWGVHVGWSGNHRSYAERLATGAAAVIGGGELLLPGEVRLAPGESYAAPWVYGSYGATGLDELSARFHDHLRARPHHVGPVRPRPVLVNTWEAVYFAMDLDRLRALADAAAAIGAERFVLDDGWFRHRRDDRAGLGDWYVDEEIWPDGLHPLVDHVRGLGLEFGLWVEPEMVNPDSDLARAHPEWILQTGGRLPVESRHQQVLDLGHPEAHAYLLDRLTAVLDEYDIGYLKWDHNRDLVDAGHTPRGEPGVHVQTLAVYRLLDELRRRFPAVEIESCSSGGGRIDLGVLQRTDRVWTSDCNDALERQSIQRWTGLLLPPELMGAHIGPPEAHTTGRRHSLGFRAGTAFFGHLGVEWDVTAATPDERAALAGWVAAHKRLRPLLHGGRVVRSDHPDPALLVHGVVAPDESEALFALVSTATGVTAPPGRVRLPGLDPARRYEVRLLSPAEQPDLARHPDAPGGHAVVDVAPEVPAKPRAPRHDWLGDEAPLRLTGRALGAAGVQAPMQWPESLVLLHVVRVD